VNCFDGYYGIEGLEIAKGPDVRDVELVVYAKPLGEVYLSMIYVNADDAETP
jgi:hypothetical protein